MKQENDILEVSIYAIPGIKKLDKNLIFKKVCKYYGKEPDEVRKFDKSRSREYVEIRQLTMALIKLKVEKASWTAAGAYFNKDHATAMHSAKTVVNLWDTDKNYRDKVSELFNGERPYFEFINGR